MVATHTLQMECYLNSCYTYYLTYQCDVSLQSPTQAVSLIWFINIFREGITAQSYSEFFSYSIKTGGPYCLYLNNIQLDYQSLTLQSEHQEYAKALTLTWCQELAFHSSKSTPRLIHSVLLEVNLIRGPCMEGFFHLWFLFGLGQWEALTGDWRRKGYGSQSNYYPGWFLERSHQAGDVLQQLTAFLQVANYRILSWSPGTARPLYSFWSGRNSQ